MALDVAAVQAALRDDGLDAWLLYDFHGSNPIASRLAGLNGSGAMNTRRWFYLLPAVGEPRALVHAIERHNLDGLAGTKAVYAGRLELEDGLQRLLSGLRTIAMEYSPGCSIPYVSRVDAGTVELIRELGIEIASSGDLVQRFEAAWDAEALRTHRTASERLHRIKDRAFEAVARGVRDSSGPTEHTIRTAMLSWFESEELMTDDGPVVATQENTASPHYQPTAAAHRAIGSEEVVLLDLWGKLRAPGAVYADITWMGYTGRQVPEGIARAFAAVREARDAATALVQSAVREGRILRGWEVDRAARNVVDAAGFGAHFVHRTGHSLGVEVHGTGVNMDDYETRDDRRLLPGAGFTIEPGI